MKCPILLFVFVAAWPLSRLSAAPPPATPRAAIARAYRQMDAAASRRDGIGSMALCDAGYVCFPVAGKSYGFGEQGRRLMRGFSVFQSARVTTAVSGLTASPAGVITIARESTAAVLRDPAEKPGTRLTVTRDVRDFWVRTPKGWRLRRRRVLSTSAIVNGTRVQSNLPAPASTAAPAGR